MKRAFGPFPSFRIQVSRRERDHLSAVFLPRFCFLGAVKSQSPFNPLKCACADASRTNTKANGVDVENLLPGCLSEFVRLLQNLLLLMREHIIFTVCPKTSHETDLVAQTPFVHSPHRRRRHRRRFGRQVVAKECGSVTTVKFLIV